jgi:hypothetical protein
MPSQPLANCRVDAVPEFDAVLDEARRKIQETINAN